MTDTKICLNGCFTVKPRSSFGKHPRSPDGLMARCKECETKRLQIARHGLTSEDKQAIAEKQGGCKVCERKAPGVKGWVVDHDHRCCPGEKSCISCRRGIICSWCNAALGYTFDSPKILRALADYLESGDRVVELNQSIESLLRVSQLTLSTESYKTDKTRRTNAEVSQLQNMSHFSNAHENRGPE